MPDEQKPLIVTVPEMRGSGTPGQVTADGHPVVLHVVPAWKIIVVRSIKSGVDTLLGTLGGSTAGTLLGWGDFQSLFLVGLSVSGGAVVVAALRNTAEYLNQWDQKHPTFTA